MATHTHEHPHAHAHPHASHGSHDHSHAPDGQSTRLLAFAFALTFAFMIVELAGGLVSGSLALLADAGHMLTDSAALALAWAASHIAQRPADARRTFGYQRMRVL